MTPTAAIEARELTRSFGSFRAVDRLTMDVASGEIFGFLGSNGAGKSTAIRIMCGLLSPTSGTARVLGIDVAGNPDAVKRSIGYMSQKFSLYDDLSVDQNLTFFGGVYGLSDHLLEDRKKWAMGMADLKGKERLVTGSLPRGWKQRLALSCAVLHEPRVLFLDEPTGGVDPASRRRFWEWIREMARAGVTVVVTTHYMEEAEQCDRLALMHAGRLITSGTLAELKRVFDGKRMWKVTADRYLEAFERLIPAPFAREASLFGTSIHVLTDQEVRREDFAAVIPTPFTAVAVSPSLEDIFIHHIQEEEGSA